MGRKTSSRILDSGGCLSAFRAASSLVQISSMPPLLGSLVMTDSHGSLRRLGRSSLIARASSWFLSALGNPSTLFPTGSLTSAIPVSTWIFPTKKISRKPLKAASLSFYKSVLKYTLYLHSIRNLFIGYKINLPKRIILQPQIPSKASTDAV